MPGSLTLKKRRVQGQTFENEIYEKLDLSCMMAYGSTWRGVTFISCDLSLADFTANTLEDVHFFDCDLAQASFRGAKLHHVIFEGCRAKLSQFAGVHPLDDVLFKDCALQYSSFADSTVRDARFVDTNLHGADLRFIECAKPPVFEGCNLWGASVTLGCTFFNGIFDERSANLFAGMLARVHPREEARTLLREIAGKQMASVERLMAGQRLDEISLPDLKEILKDIRKPEDAALGEGWTEFPGC